MSKKIRMDGEEFVKKILSGERDFRNIDLGGYNFDKTNIDPLIELASYLNKNNEPIILHDSDLSNITARVVPISLPRLHAERTSFKGAKIPWADLRHSILIDCDFSNVDARFSNFEYSLLSGTKLNGSNFSKSNFDNATLIKVEANRCNFYKSSFCDATIGGLLGFDLNDEESTRAFYKALRTTAKNSNRREIFRYENPEYIIKALTEIIRMEYDDEKLIREIIEREHRNSLYRRTISGIGKYLRESIKRSLEYRI